MPKSTKTTKTYSGKVKKGKNKGMKYTSTSTVEKSAKKGFATDEAKLKSQKYAGKTTRSLAYTEAARSSIKNITDAVSENAKAKMELNKYLNDVVSDTTIGQDQRDEESGGQSQFGSFGNEG